MSYRCLSKHKFIRGDFELSVIRKEHIMQIRQWRNEQMNLLRQKTKISKTEQLNYFEKNIWPTFEHNEPTQILFSFFKGGKLVGYGGLVHISWEDLRAEVSFLVDTEIGMNPIIYPIFFAKYIELIKEIAFDNLAFNRLFTETYDIRPLHIDVLEKNGFIFEGRMRQNNIIDKQLVDSLIHGIIKIEYENSKKY